MNSLFSGITKLFYLRINDIQQSQWQYNLYLKATALPFAGNVTHQSLLKFACATDD